MIYLAEDPLYLLEKWLRAKEYIVIGKSIRRVDAIDKVTGRAKFMEDYLVPNMVYVKLVLSSEPHARIRKIYVDDALAMRGVVRVITASDIPGENQVGYAIPDQPLLAEGKVRYCGEPIALVAAEEPEITYEASLVVKVDLNHYQLY